LVRRLFDSDLDSISRSGIRMQAPNHSSAGSGRNRCAE